MKQPSKPWRPFTANCCSTEDQTIFKNFSRCKPSRSDLSKNIAPLPSFRRLSFSDLSRSSSTRINEDLAQSFGSDLFDFQLSELRAITQNFSSNFLLGEGGFGTVHKGYIDDNLRLGLKAQPVAVKLLDIEGLQGHREWLAEVIFLGQLRHPNLVKLIGYCCEDEERLLVYEFMPRGSLENHLFRRLTSLPWGTRLKIATGAAKGLSFLHGAEKPVIYRDFKTSNVLLDSGAKEMAHLALQCISLNPKDRPRMPTIVETLEGLQQYKDMAVTSGHWPVSPKSTKNRVSNNNKVNVKARAGANHKQPSPVPSRKT
ncbi:hypothetical protein JHK85_001912 [Glycine max]|nr:hypothetical protein JHK85_001912 [Glycine max]